MTKLAIPRIFCVEDDKDTCEVMTILLSEIGCEVVTVSTPIEGLELARVGGFAAIVLDNRYAMGNGVELCKQIRAFDLQTPIIFYSGAAEQSDIQSGLTAGAQAYVIKPEIDLLISTVTRMIPKENGASRGFGREDNAALR